MPQSNTGERLVGLGCMVVELADATLAERDTDGAQALIELAMSVFQTAFSIEPRLEAEVEDARTRLKMATESVRRSSNRLGGDDPDSIWPYGVV